MAEDQKPTQEGAAPEQAPDWEVKDGRVFIEGVDVTDIASPHYEDEKPDDVEAPQADEDNAAVEGEGQEPEEPETPKEPEPEPEPKAEEPKDEAEPEDEEPEEPATWDFKLKFRGKTEEVAWTQEEVQHRLSKLRAFEENEREFWDKRREVEPYYNIVKSDWFKERMKEAYESGELKEPPKPPEPPATVQYEVLKRQADPDYDSVLNALQTYALSLPPEAMQLIDSDPTVFLSEYDRIAEEVRGRKPSSGTETPKKPPKKSPEDVKKDLERKEAAKTRAQTNKPGSQPPPPPSPLKQWENERRKLERAMKDPNNAHLNLELTARLLEHLDKRPQT